MRHADGNQSLAARWRARARRSVRLARGALAGCMSWITACDYTQYPIEATFCDDWCHTLRRTRCDQEPENCIRDCENSLAGPACLDRQVSLLECYQTVPPTEFACVGQGFQGEVRPRPEICTAERDELIACEAPHVKRCIDACRDVAASEGPIAALDARPAHCPSTPFPCERLCWAIDELSAGALAAPSGALDAGITDPRALSEMGAPVIRCAFEEARLCVERAGSEPASDGSVVSWTSLFFRCAGLPGLSLDDDDDD